MYKVIVTTLLVLLANVGGWGACTTQWAQNIWCYPCTSLSGNYDCCRDGSWNDFSICQMPTDGAYNGGYRAFTGNCRVQSCQSSTQGVIECEYNFCSSKCEADSLAGCPEGQEWDSATCQCKASGPPLPPPGTCTYCEDYMGWAEEESVIGPVNMQVPYSRMYRCKNCVRDANGFVTTAFDCEEMRNSPGTCRQNGDCPSNQICADSTGDDSPVQCIATFGSEVWMKDIKTGNTFKCSADGSCERAKLMVASGECKNPYADKNKPNSSDSNDPNSSDSNDPNSSSAENPPESSGEFCDMCDKLDRIAANTQATMNNTSDISQWTQETMNQTIDIKNQLTEYGVDISHIRTNTEETATNTGSIDNKLNTTNSLLNDIKNKNWNPQINVNPPTVNVGGDTIIVNVGGDTTILNADTAKAPAEILGFLQGVFGDSAGNYNPDDTAGSGVQIEGVLNKIDSLVGEGMPVMNSDSVSNAMGDLKNNGLGAIRDTIGNSAISDSMTAWGQKITDNGYITGQGSDNCPEILTRTWQVNFPIGTGGANVNIGPLGVYLCKPVAGMGITFWALCRVILRAMVAIACMIWLYKSVLGIDGGSNDED